MIGLKNWKIFFVGIFALLMPTTVLSQGGQTVMWRPVPVEQRDLFNGAGGKAMRPNTRRITFIKRDTGGNNLKYRIKDASGRIWVAKIADESQPEVAANRLLYGLGYVTEIDYLAPRLRIPGKKIYTNVRLEARPSSIERVGNWKWNENPFVESDEFYGLRIMMAMINNWDLKDTNNAILRTAGEDRYAVSDLGSSFGKLAVSSKFILNRIGRNVNAPADFRESDFIRGVRDGQIDFAYKGKGVGLMEGITPRHARWLANLLNRLSDKQIRDAFRAANYNRAEINMLTAAFKSRIRQLDRVGSGTVAASVLD
ncbi:MAG TPA: hypothetical protein VNA22_07050 [Pyrinomonadaceae bacterium]|nr:hypothetical protein [Pyrinomonadaceae bacterium]